MSERSAPGMRAAAVHAAALLWRAAPVHAAGYLAVSLAGALVPVAVAWMTKLTLDRLASPGAVGAVLGLAAGLAAAGLLGSATPQSGQYLRAEIDRRGGLLAKDELFAAVERYAGLARFEDPAFLDRLRLAQQSAQNPGYLLDAMFSVGRGALALIGFAGSLTVVSPWLTVAVLLASLPAFVVELRLARQRAAMAWDVEPVHRLEFAYTMLLSTVEAAKEIRLLAAGPWLRGRMIGQLRRANAAQRAMDRRELGQQTGLALLGAVVSGGGLVWVILGAAGGRLTVGDVSMFVAAVAGVQSAVDGLVQGIAMSHQRLLVFGHYLAVAGAGPDLPEPAAPRELPRLSRGIELRDVWFRYGDDHPWVLRGVDLVIPYGQAVALVGRNGSGKSTLVKLLCRFYDPSRGAILWDGVDIRDVPVAELRQRVGAVFQDFMTYDLSALDNIAIGDLSALDDPGRIEAAARRAGVHDVLAALPEGYRTPLTRTFFSETEREGVALSGGQWQRVALARAFLRADRDLMILDEPSAGLDAEAEHDVHTMLRRIRGSRSSLLISHRLGAVRDADLIVVLADGMVAERGRHDELLAAEGTYAHLFALQAAGYAGEPVT
ncbi:ABC transporter ATP-binding protein [Nonomuraea roseoviolacea subsp. roseoviolacea]|uniref:ABC transporter ATP-binding protein n=1 Tax=Nonomuraea roseoviolacea TaxID=103837 RepID=UPI0031CDDF88